jgi:hypothetical protein
MERRYSINDVDEARQLTAALVDGQGATARHIALDGAAEAVGVSRWSLWTIYYGRRKTVASGTLRALRDAYRRLLERQAAHLEAEMASLKERCGEDGSVVALGDEVSRLVSRLRDTREGDRSD